MATSSNGPDRQKLPKVFVRRDYSEGTEVKFETKLPEGLVGIIDDKTYEEAISGLNAIYHEAEKFSRETCLESCLAYFMCSLNYVCFEAHWEKYLKKAAAYVQQQNRITFGPLGLELRDPVERGLRVMEIRFVQIRECDSMLTSPTHSFKDQHICNNSFTKY